MAAPNQRVDLKVVTVGAAGVGKTSIIYRYVHGTFTETTIPTIAAAFALKPWRAYKLGIWDTAGTEKYAMLSSFYCRSAGAAVLAYDITDRQSFLDLDKFLRMLRDGGAQPDCFLVVTGTKLDLVQKQLRERAVSEEEAQAYASNLGAAYIETSAISGHNIAELFDLIGNHLEQRTGAAGAAGGSAPASAGGDGRASSGSAVQLGPADAAHAPADKGCAC